MGMITVQDLQDRLAYCPVTGKFWWKYHAPSGDTFNTRYADTEVYTSVDKHGYLRIRITHNGKRVKMLAHRVAWILFYGVFPTGTIDHKNHIRTDNSMFNLRDIPPSEQKKNLSMPTGHEYGVFGVYWDNSREKWKAQIKVDGKTVNIGRYDTFEEAAEARGEAEIRYGFYRTHGS